MDSGRRHFTLAEVLAALVFVAVVLPAGVRAVLVAGRAGTVAARRRTAVELASELLAELVVDDGWLSADSSGDFGEEHAGYRWRLGSDVWQEEVPEIRLLRAEVFFQIRAREHSVELATLVREPSGETSH